MHLPDPRIGAGGVKRGPVIGGDRSERNGGAGQDRLKIGRGHGRQPIAIRRQGTTGARSIEFDARFQPVEQRHPAAIAEFHKSSLDISVNQN